MRKSRTPLSLLGAFAIGVGSPASAQTPASDTAASPDPRPPQLEEIIVTARRVSENQQKVPLAVTTLTGAAIGRRGVQTVSDLQFNVPNLQIKPSAISPTAPEFIIRGQRQTLYTDENVVTYVNGVPQSTRGLTLYDLESVQALKGPQGTLFGKNSNGGAMVFTTTRPTFATTGQLDLEYGNFDRKAATGILNLPLIDGKLALRLAGDIQRRDGFFTNVYPGGRPLFDQHEDSARVTLLATPTERLENLTTLDYLRRNEIPSPTVIDAAPLDGSGFIGAIATLTRQGVVQQSQLGGSSAVAKDGLLLRTGNPYRVSMPTGLGTTLPNDPYFPVNTFASFVKTYGVANTTTYRLDDQLSLRNIFGYRYEKAIDEVDPDGLGGYSVDVAPFLQGIGIPDLPSPLIGQVVNNNSNYLNITKTLSNELQLIGHYDDIKFIVGAFASRSRLFSNGTSYFVVGPVSLYAEPNLYQQEKLRSTSTALFAQGTYDFAGVGWDGLHLTLGARHTWDRRRYKGQSFYTTSNDLIQNWPQDGDICAVVAGTGRGTTGVNDADTCLISGKKSYRALTWTASLDYQIDPRTLVYFTNRRGYKAGSANPTTVNLDFVFYNPERLTDFEIGLKREGRIGGAPYRFNIDGFIGNYRKIQTQDVLTFCADAACSSVYTSLVIFNTGKATIKGIELEGSIKPIPAVTLDFGYSYQVGRYGKGSVIPQPRSTDPIGPSNPLDPSYGTDLSGAAFAGVPRHTLNAAISYDLGFIPRSFAAATLNLNYAYRSKLNGIEALGVYHAPGFGLLNGRLSLNQLLGSPLSLTIWGRNLTNKVYKLYCSDNLNSLGFVSCLWGEPRTYGLTGSFKF